MDTERLKVIDNIKKAIDCGDSFRKVELNDHVVTDSERRCVILPFDNLRRKPINRLKAKIAERIANKQTARLNTHTEIVGLENALSVEGGAIITCNHFSIMDSTLIRLLVEKCDRKKKLYITVEESNVFMKGFFGFLMKNCNTLPISPSTEYMAKNLMPAIKKVLSDGAFVLVYPEEEMWFNYKKPRELRGGAYHFAYSAGVPVIPCFVEMNERDTLDPLGFYEISHTLHVMPPIYPNTALSKREAREDMRRRDREAKRACYELAYGRSPDSDFSPEQDIAGYNKTTLL